MTQKTEKTESIWSLTYVILIIICFFFSMGQMMSTTIMPLYARDLGASATIIGFVVSVFYISALAIRPFSGPAFDSFSKKRLLQIAYAITVAAFFSYVNAKTIPVIIATRIIHGFAVGCIAPLSMAFVSDILPKGRMGAGVSIYTTAQVVAQVIGPALGIELTRIIGYSNTFLVAAISMTAAGLLTISLKEPAYSGTRPPYKISLSRIISKKGIPVAACLLLMAFGFSSILSFVAVYAEAQDMMQIGVYFIVYALVMVVSRPICGNMADKYGTDKVLIPSMILFAAALVVLSFSHTLPAFILVAVMAALGYGVSLPLLQSMAFRFVPRSQSGAASNTNYLAMDIGSLSGPIVGGAIVDFANPLVAEQFLSYSWMFRCMVIPVIVALVLFIFLRPLIARYEAEAEQQAKAASSD